MRFPSARRLALTALLPALLAFSVVPGCSNESEGERCGDDPFDPNGIGNVNDDDCSAPLVCVAASTLVQSGANRCCNPNVADVNDPRCIRNNGIAADAGADSSPGAAGASNSDANDADAAASAGAPGAGGSN
jgi:hypothetical protein